MGGLNLEVFKFGTYVMFPIGIMYYFGTNLDNRFAVSGFWPKPEECNKLPHDREEIKAEYERIVARQKLRLARKVEEQRRFAGEHPELHEQQQRHQSQKNES